jgi:hypothetical protein
MKEWKKSVSEEGRTMAVLSSRRFRFQLFLEECAQGQNLAMGIRLW